VLKRPAPRWGRTAHPGANAQTNDRLARRPAETTRRGWAWPLQRSTAVTTLAAALCPDCPVGREAREMVFSDAFWTNAWYAFLPFVVVLLAVRWFVRRIDQGVDDARIDGA
jgi:hypothetical protein